MPFENHTEVIEDPSSGQLHFPFLVHESEDSFYHSVYRLMYGPDHNSTTSDASLTSFSATHVKWISAIGVTVVVIIYFCLMTAWGKHKKKQSQQSLLNRRQEALAPFQLYSAICMSSQQQRPPSYAQATGLYDLPPSYEAVKAVAQQEKVPTVSISMNLQNEASKSTGPLSPTDRNCAQSVGFVNVALDIEEGEGSTAKTNADDDKAKSSQQTTP